MAKMRFANVNAVVAVVFGMAFGAMVSSQEELDPQLQRLLADWAKRRAYPAVRYDVKGTVLSTQESVEAYNKGMNRNPSYQAKDQNLAWNLKLTLDVKGGRHRLEEETDYFHLTKGEVERVLRLSAFDGSTMYSARDRDIIAGKELDPKPGVADVAIYTGNFDGAFFNGQLAALFAGHGALAFPPQHYLIPGKLDRDPEMAQLTLHGTNIFEGRKCLVLRSYPRQDKAYQEIWVDVARASAVVRLLSVVDGFPYRETNIPYKQIDGLWLVGNWTQEMRNWDPATKKSTTSEVYRFEVVKAELAPNPPESEFRLAIEPGMLVRKTYNDPKKNPLKKEGQGKPEFSRVGPSGSQTPVHFENGIERRSGNPWLWWVAGLMAGAFAVSYAAWRYWKRNNELANTKVFPK